MASDWPSKSELFGTFPTLSDRLDDLDVRVAGGGSLFTVAAMLPWPVEEIGWDPTTQPVPFANSGLAGQYLLLVDQDAYPAGVWRFTDDPVSEPPVFVIDPCDTGVHGYQYQGLRVSVASVGQSLYGDVVCAIDPSTGGMFYATVGAASPSIVTAYTDDVDVSAPPTLSDGVTPLVDLSFGFPLPILLVGQSDPSENGFWFATANRATRTRLRDRPTGFVDPVLTAIGDNGAVGTAGDWWNPPNGTTWSRDVASGVLVRLNRYYPASPVTPHLMRSKYITVDPDFPLDGSATHVGGQSIDDGQNITITSNASGNGGVWTLSLTGSAVRAQGFGSLVDTDIGNYDLVSFTGTRWGYESVWRLYGNPTTKGLTLVTGAESVSRSYRPDLIVTDDSPFDVAEADGSTTTITPDGTSMPGTLGVLFLPAGGPPEMRTYVDGVLVMTEDFTEALGIWIARGVGGVGKGAVASTDGDGSGVLLT